MEVLGHPNTFWDVQDYIDMYVNTHNLVIGTLKECRECHGNPRHLCNEACIKLYVEGLLREFMHNPEIKLCLTLKLCNQFPSYTRKFSNKMKAKTACSKTNAGKFLKHVREVNSLTIESKADFGDPSHSTNNEPFYYETAYLYSFQPTKLTIDKTKCCLSIVNVSPNFDEFVNNEPIPIDEQGRAHITECSVCSYACHTVSDEDVDVILDLKCAFEKPFSKIREQLQNIDIDCPHVHHLKPRGMGEGLETTEITKAGHPLPCVSGICAPAKYEYCVLLQCTIQLYVNSSMLYIWPENIIVLWLR